MPSTSSVNKSNNQRNSSSTNYNESSIVSQIPRQILPMSRPATAQTYQQPQIIVPTQCGFGEMLPNSNFKEISSNILLSMDYYDNYNQANCFAPPQHYNTYFSQQQQQIYSQQIQQQYLSIQAQQQAFMSKQQLVQQTASFQQDPQLDTSTFCDECRASLESMTLQNLCIKCKNKYIGFNNYRNSTASAMLQQQQQQQQQHQQQQHQQNVQQTPRVVPRTMSSLNNAPQQHSPSMNHSMTPSHVVPTQTLNNVQPLLPMDSISDYSMPIDFSLDQSPTICYDENSEKNSCSKNKVLNDVFFSDPMIEDTEEVFQFDSDSSSDTDILTPRQGYSPPMSPVDFGSSDDLLRMIYGDVFDLSKDKSVIGKSSADVSKFSDSQSGSDVNSTTVKVVSPTTTATVSSTKVSVTSSLNSTSVSPTIDPTLITIDPRFITSSMETTTTTTSSSSNASSSTSPSTSSSPAAQNAAKKLPPVITRPNHIELGDGIPSPPLKTPELVSDHSIKRRMSESSSDDDISDAESNRLQITNQKNKKSDKQAQKKLRVDLKKSIKITDDKRNDVEEEESDSSNSSSSYGNENDDDEMESSNEVHDISDTVTDEYHYSSDTDSEEDDDEEYRPTNNKKPRTTRKIVKPQGKARNTLKNSFKTKSVMVKNKSKAVSAKRGKQSSKSSKPSSKRSSGANTPVAVPIESPPQCISTPSEESQEMEGLEATSPRPTLSPTIFQTLTKSGIDWCRYCGTTEGVNWRPGPWGKRTLCNKHGCDYKGYGFACKLPRLDLTGFINESVEDRDRPVLQLFCTVCQKQESFVGNVLVRCEGCPKAFHQKCFSSQITDETVSSEEQWFCEGSCSDNVRRKRIVVELPRKKLPLMSTPKVQVPVSTIEAGAVPSGTVSRPRTSRNSSRV